MQFQVKRQKTAWTTYLEANWKEIRYRVKNLEVDK